MKQKTNNMETFKRTKKHLHIALVVFGISVAVAVTLYVLVGMRIEVAQGLAKDLQRAEQDDLVVLKRTLRAYNEHADVLDALILDAGNELAYISDIETLAKDAGTAANIERVTVSDVGNDGNVYQQGEITASQRLHGQLSLQVRVSGSWASVMDLLLRLENIPHQVAVQNVRLASSVDQTTGASAWVALFTIDTITE